MNTAEASGAVTVVAVASSTMQFQRVVFLDFDGVLHPAGGTPGAGLPFEWVPELSDLLLPYPDVGIVVHSSWAERFSLDELREFLQPLGSRVIGKVESGAKSETVAMVMQAHREIHRWLIVDDDASQFPSMVEATVVVCDRATGISDTSVRATIRRWLQED